MTTAVIVEEIKLILADIGVNSNKFWQAKRYEDCTVVTEWGRVGETGASKTFSFPDAESAAKYLKTKRKEKERKGYSEQRTIGGTAVIQKANVAAVIKTSDDTRELVDYLVKVNIHQITSHTNIQFDIASGSFTTPLGIVTKDGIDEAEKLLATMGQCVVERRWDSTFVRYLNSYMRIVPSDIGRKRVEPRALYPTVREVQAQQQILDSLKASLQTLETQAKPADEQAASYRAHLTAVPDDGGPGTELFKRILRKYLDSRNDRHQAAKLKLKKVYKIELLGMSSAFERDGAKLQNVWELWHGTRAANLLSIMNTGYVIPRAGGSIQTTGRMYGDGVYFSDQSTKSLNYSYGYWGGGRQDKSYMILNDVGMGNYFVPNRSFSGGCRSGYDSTFAKAGHSGVINNEMIVYRTSQIKPNYLCEFGE